MEKNLTKQTYHNHSNNLPDTNFSSIKITLASPEKIKSWSFSGTISEHCRRANRGYELAQEGHVVRKSRTCATKENVRRVCLGNQVDPAPSQCLCPGNPSPGHTKRQITMIAGASRGEWLRGPMHFEFGVLGTHKTIAGRLSPDEVALSWMIRRLHIFARDRTPRTAGGLTPP